MRRQFLMRRVAGLLTVSVALPAALYAASPAFAGWRVDRPSDPASLIRVQADCAEGESAEDCAARLRRERAPAQEEPAAPAEPAPAEEEPPPPPEPAPEEPAPQREAAPEPAPAEQQAEPEQAPEPQRRERAESQAQEPARDVERQRPERERPRREQPSSEQPAEPAPEAQPEQQDVPDVAPQPEPAPEAERPQRETPPEAETPEAAPTPAPAPEQETPEATPLPAPAPDAETPDAAPVPEQAPDASEAERPSPPADGAGEPAPDVPAEPPVEQPDQGAARPEGEAPVLDSQKQQPAAPPPAEPPAEGGTAPAPADGQAEAPPPADPGPPPESDAAAQQQAQPAEIQPVTAEQGRRIERKPEDRPRRERPSGTDVLREIGDRVILQFNNQTIVESNERPRMSRGARDVYYEELPRGRVRETIVRGDGTEVVTIRNAYGDVVRRSRITPDGREYVLVYVEDEDYARDRDWRDPGEDLPPLRLTIPVEDYVLESDRAHDADAYYRFLEQPPVERVERLYSVDEVKRSARIRDKTRRVDLDTITFEFGSASISESEIPRLEGVAQAMERMLEKNPAETFLIEGHTDAVGSDIANLALSDRRAEAVAEALSNVFGIPPENLATQGYGEQYLKVRTQSPERENRRVAIRRITPLVAPVASNR